MTVPLASTPPNAEARRSPRIPVDMPARLALGDLPEVTCRALNVSVGGAMLAISEGVALPDHFSAAIGEMDLRTCRLIWRDADKVGIAWT